jgi:hypothetical protein
MKTNREKNTAHDSKERERVRPAAPVYDFKPLEAVIRQWVTMNEQT